MIDSNYLSLNIPGELELIPSNLLYSSPLDSSSPSTNHFGLYDYYGDYENQNDLNNINVNDFTYTDMINNSVIPHAPSNGYHPNAVHNDDGYNITNLTNQLFESIPSISPTSPYQPSSSAIVTSSTNEVNHRYSSTSSVSSASLSSSDYVSSNQRPLSATSIDSIDATRSIDGCKRDLIKATLNFAIKSRRRSRGLGEIELKHVKSQEPRASSWTDEDDEKKMSRRERNRIAARKCRKNRKLKYIGLNKTMENLDTTNSNLREQLIKLERESEKLEDLLSSHQSSCYLVSWSSQPMLTSGSTHSPSLSSSSPSPNHPLINRNKNHSQSDESHGFISYINQSQLWSHALQ